MNKIQLTILGITYSQPQSGAYVLILGETNGKRRLPIIIGGFEAQSIAIELEKMKPSRSLTHDLFKSFSKAFSIDVIEVFIYKFSAGVFFAKLICKNDNHSEEIDARTSDAVAIAVRFNCPVYTNEAVLKAASVFIDEDESKQKDENADEKYDDSTYSSLTIEELDEMLMSAIDEEAYEKASKIRDEINKKTKKK